MRPRHLQYKNHKLKYRHYGRIVESLVEKAKTMEDGAEREEMVSQLIEAMKKSYASWNNASITPEVVFNQLYEMSDGVLDYRNGFVRVKHEEPIENNKENNVSDE